MLNKCITVLKMLVDVVGGLGTITALVISLYNFIKMRKDEQSKQASSVSAWLEMDEIAKNFINESPVTIRNASDSPIYDVVISAEIINKGYDPIGKGDERCKFFDLVPPGKYYTSIQLDHGMCRHFNVSISFKDKNNISWTRDARGKLKCEGKKEVTEIRCLSLPTDSSSLYQDINKMNCDLNVKYSGLEKIFDFDDKLNL